MNVLLMCNKQSIMWGCTAVVIGWELCEHQVRRHGRKVERDRESARLTERERQRESETTDEGKTGRRRPKRGEVEATAETVPKDKFKAQDCF